MNLGNVTVGSDTWIGPNVVLDGSGGLSIGNLVTVCAGVQIYTHTSVDWSVSCGASSISRKSTTIGNGVYIRPNSVIAMGVSIGDGASIGAMSFVNKDVPSETGKCLGY